jgi:Protein of unknown function (DUF1203)
MRAYALLGSTMLTLAALPSIAADLTPPLAPDVPKTFAVPIQNFDYERRERSELTSAAIDEIPDQLRRRLLSVRAFSADGMMVDADVVEGHGLQNTITKLFADERAAYLHVHFAIPGCYAAPVDRA